MTATGVTEWQKALGTGFTRSMIQTADGGYLIGGGAVAGGVTGVLHKVAADGTVIWRSEFSTSGNLYINSVVQNPSGTYTVAGYSNAGGIGGNDIWIAEVDASGASVWQKSYGGAGNEYGLSLYRTFDGGYVVAGYSDTLGAGFNDTLLLKLDSVGALQWSHTYGGTSWDQGASVQQTVDGGFILTGQTNVGAGMYVKDAWILKLDGSGMMAGNAASAIGTPTLTVASSGFAASQTVPVSANVTSKSAKNYTITPTGTAVTPAAVTFALYTVDFTVAPATAGILTGSASQTAITSGGSTSAVTATANTGYHFVNWTGTGGFATTTMNPLTVTNVTANMTITANFAPIPTRVAYIYNSDTAARDSFNTFLTSKGLTVDLVALTAVETYDFTSDQLILVGYDTGNYFTFGGNTYLWGTTAAASQVKNAGKPVLGLGFGGGSFFQTMGLYINWANSWIDSTGSQSGVIAVNPASTLFSSPLPVQIDTGNNVTLFTAGTTYIAVYLPTAQTGVAAVGLQTNDTNHYPLIEQTAGNKYFLWGFNGSPATMTTAGKNLFYNTLAAFTPDSTPPTDGVLTASAVSSTQVNLSWTAASDSGSGLATNNCYKLVRATGTVTPACTDTAVYQGTVSSYNDSGLAVGTHYSYRVCASDAFSNVSVGATAQATTYSVSTYGHIRDVNTLALWRLDETTASANAVDETGMYTLTQFGTPDVIPGRIDNGRLLNGTTKYFQKQGDAAFGAAMNGDWTYEGWAYIDPANNAGAVLFIYNGLAFSFNNQDTILAEVAVIPDSGGNRKLNWQQWQTTGTYAQGASAVTLQPGQYYHLAVSRTAQGGNLFTYKMYVNGALDTTTTNVVGLSYPVTGATHYIGLGNYTDIGGFGVGSAKFNGRLDDTRISKVARSDAEILASYQRTAPTYTVNFGVTPSGSGTITGATVQSGIASGGSTTAVTAAANPGYHFVNWSGTGGFVTTPSNPLMVANVTAHMAISATFAADVVIPPVDTTPPVITTVNLPPTNPTLTLPIPTSAITGSDNTGITGYLLSDSATTPPATDPGWQPTVPQTFTFKTWGNNVIYTFCQRQRQQYIGPKNHRRLCRV
jgi:uncharacterized repeat protein (TIGR02543 family)